MTSEIIAALVGAAIALVGGIVGAFLHHFLSLRTDRIKRERDRREEEARSLRKKKNEAETRDRDSKEREVERLREVLLESVSTRLETEDLEKFLEEVERKRDEDGLRWAERSRQVLENWLTERLQEAIEEPDSQEDSSVELSD